jgi:GGDEF domain-containing protein
VDHYLPEPARCITLGHPAGDVLLAQVAARLRAVVRQMDTIARFDRRRTVR